MVQPNLSFSKAVFKILWPYWRSEKKWEALFLLLCSGSFLAAFVFTQLELNYWGNDFYTALQEFRMNDFFGLLKKFSYLAALAISTYVLAFYAQKHLELRWRKWLTHFYIQKWLSHRNYYHLLLAGSQTDNPDQRIAEDVGHFCSETIRLFLDAFRNILMLIAFLGVLWVLSGTLKIPLGDKVLEVPGYMFWAGLIYAIIGSFISVKIGNPLVPLNYEQEKREADFRYSLIRFRENAEGIALYSGENSENQTFGNRFEYVYDNFKSIIKRSFMISGWISFYGQIAYVFPILLIAPRYFAKEVTFGALMQTIGACNHVNTALSFFVDQYPAIAHWKATTNRLLVFLGEMEELEKLPKEIRISPHPEPSIISCRNLTIFLPHEKILFENLNLKFQKGEHTLIKGPSGIGKSTLMRTLSGLWPYGSGQIQLPTQSPMFLPQKPYMPLGTLKEILTYPEDHAKLEEKDFLNLLDLVGLENLSGRLNEIDDWARVLSLGEQQRVSILRALIQKPQWLLMDEATSSLDEDSERKVFELLQHVLKETTFISVGHRASLLAWHPRVISLEDLFQGSSMMINA
ncbi:ABC transporter ATP-binding protein/permease [Candidatus Bealeia paramacronuclearis]|uniref:ABC transporter ATP-binding protein/permease n=1 Tax=Candidatus Bealeia paramacronuclearis TaxID=1921001 RepID=A0ABZ2C163_9PROT|nr:ABC transporter ATP-binding protein/permease [Candidatus Bealeia paramacronuclearis]